MKAHRLSFLLLFVLCAGVVWAAKKSPKQNTRVADLSFHSAVNTKNVWPLPEPVDRLPAPLVPRFMRPLRIVIDPGHGGHDDGAHGILGTLEKDLSLRLAHKIKLELMGMAASAKIPVLIRLTRKKDQFISLAARAKMANAWEADLFLSIHGNASPSSRPRGFEVYFLSDKASDDHTKYLVRKENDYDGPKFTASVASILSDLRKTNHIEESSDFAHTLYRVMKRSIRSNRRGVRQGPFAVLYGTQMPAVLLEVGYLTNRHDARNLKRWDYLNRLVSAISSGILEYATSLRKLG